MLFPQCLSWAASFFSAANCAEARFVTVASLLVREALLIPNLKSLLHVNDLLTFHSNLAFILHVPNNSFLRKLNQLTQCSFLLVFIDFSQYYKVQQR